uniref:FMN hydroxy acid dehydrogenase domain-containing protein n=1 Tax=Parastrongyloides trichosuri TaxID=131310 RepID=A0A0N4ZVZ4_PARTI
MNSADSFSKKLICLKDIEEEALRKLPKTYGDYFKGGSDDEITLRRNIEAYKKLLIRPYCLRDVSKINTEVFINLGGKEYKYSHPIGVSPTAFHELAYVGGERLTVKACHKANIPVIFSTMGNVSVGDIRKEINGDCDLWFQLYVYKNRNITKELINNAKNAGFKAIVMTVDTPVVGKRRRDIKNSFKLPENVRLANLENISFLDDANKKKLGTTKLMEYSSEFFDHSLTWKDLKWLIDFSEIPVIVKGIMREDDAEKAIEAGAAAIMISNHGGRQLDTCISTIEALPSIARVVNKRIPIFIDGGVRNGSDIFKALYFGADMVFIGRPILYGLAIGGEDGIKYVIDILKEEFERTMKLAGCHSIEFIKNAKKLVIDKVEVSKI